MISVHVRFFFFFFNDTATTEIYTLSLHDALPICFKVSSTSCEKSMSAPYAPFARRFFSATTDRKSTRLNSSHLVISYAVFCLKKKKKAPRTTTPRRCASSCLPAPNNWSVRLHHRY